MSLISNPDPQEYYFDAEGCYITELANCDADPSLSIARARVTPGAITAWHRLSNTTERYYILSGTGIVEIDDLPPTAVNAGDVVMIQSMQRQRITNNGQADLVFLAICTPRFEPENYQRVD